MTISDLQFKMAMRLNGEAAAVPPAAREAE
jgi:hypothetical protein